MQDQYYWLLSILSILKTTNCRWRFRYNSTILYCLYKGSLKHISRGSQVRSRALSATSERKPLYFPIINLQLFSILLSCFIIWPFPAFLLDLRQWLSISFTSGTDDFCKNITYINSFSKGDICSSKGVFLLCHFTGPQQATPRCEVKTASDIYDRRRIWYCAIENNTQE